MLGFRRRWRRGLLGLYRAALLHTSISSDSLSSFPLPAFLSPARSILFPSFPSDIRGLPPLPTPFPTFSASSTFSSSSASSYGFTTQLPPLPPRPAQPLAYPSRLTYLNPPFLSLLSPSSFSQPRHPSALFLAASVSRRLTSVLSYSRPLPRNAPTDKQTADTLQFYAIVSFFICLLIQR